MDKKLDISVISPVFNELENLETFVESVAAVMNSTNMSWELIIVDDGSNDGSSKILKKIGHQENIRSILLSKNYGQTTAIQAGFDNAVGEYFVTLDSDLQNDPKDIPTLIQKLINEELDLVVGWRKDRKDNYFFRNLPSNLANKLIGTITGVKLHDYGCSLKAYRAEVLKEVKFVWRNASFYTSMDGNKNTSIKNIRDRSYTSPKNCRGIKVWYFQNLSSIRGFNFCLFFYEIL